MYNTKSQVSVVSITRVKNDSKENVEDLLAVEEPLQIRLQFKRNGSLHEESLTVTMRTPGNDFELAAGFMFAENIISHPDDILHIRHCQLVKEEEQGNVVMVKLAPNTTFDMKQLKRNFLTNSSCGVCGKSAIDAIYCKNKILTFNTSQTVNLSLIYRLNESLKEHQTVFRHTGGLHASALFKFDGECLLIREDIGRHNALDKLIGAALTSNMTPLEDTLIFLSGRVSYELVQKAIRAEIPIIVAVGAPSSLAVELAIAKGVTLIGFLRGKRFNIYTYPKRIKIT